MPPGGHAQSPETPRLWRSVWGGASDVSAPRIMVPSPEASPDLPTVLLVEDDDLLAEVLKGLLAPHAQVTWAASAEGALELLPTCDWDLLISDIELPGMDGLALVRIARDRHPQISALMLSGHADFDHAVAAIRAGADDYLPKPVDRKALITKTNELTELARTRKAAARSVVLAIGAHPDDVEIGVGGILLGHTSRGDNVNVLTLTGGEAGGEPGLRAREAEEAAGLMGARLFHADLEDTSLSVSDGGVTIGAISSVIAEISPTVIYTHTLLDVHQDHRNVHRATLVAARGVPRVFCYQAPSTTVEFQPTRFVAIDDFMDRKLEVIRAYGSQATTRGYLDEELTRATARYWARFTRGRYVEPLEVERDSDVQGSVHIQPDETEEILHDA
jgi:LmbE family N-acetylglucosaminyl deacetylase